MKFHYRGFGKVARLRTRRQCTTCSRIDGERTTLNAEWEVELVTRPTDPDSDALVRYWCEDHFKWWRDYDKAMKDEAREKFDRAGVTSA